MCFSCRTIGQGKQLRIDLNLLIVFEAVMHEQNVTRAAKRLQLSQPAVSGSLARLRDLVGDPLFVRTGRGLRPTPAAHQLVGPVNEALTILRDALQRGATFDRETSTRVFTLMTSDIGEIIYLPRLIERVRAEAPHVRLAIRRLARSTMADELAFGGVDLALGHVEACPPALREEPLFNETFACMVRTDHPTIGTTMTRELFATHLHLLVARPAGPGSSSLISQDGLVAHRLNELNITRNIALSVPDFLAVSIIIAKTDLIVTIPRRLAEAYREEGHNRVLPLPFDVESFPVSQFWHARSDDDPGGCWLRRIVRELFGEVVVPFPELGASLQVSADKS